MNRIVLYTLSIILIVSVFGGCKAKKGLVKKETRTGRDDGMIKSILSGQLDYQSIEIKGSTRAEMDGRNYALSITYRNIKDEKLWVSVRAMLGIEAARIIADRDSVWVVSKLAQTKEKGSWKDMSKMIGYPLDFMALQSIMTRKLFYPGQTGVDKLSGFQNKDQGGMLMIVPDYENTEQRNDMEVYGFLPQFKIDKNRKHISSTKLAPEDNEWMLEVGYDDMSTDNLGIGKSILLNAIDSQNKMNLNIKIQGVKINESLKFPFQWF